MASSSPTKKQGFMSRLFSNTPPDSKKRTQRMHSVDASAFRDKDSVVGLYDDNNTKTVVNRSESSGGGTSKTTSGSDSSVAAMSKRKQSMPATMKTTLPLIKIDSPEKSDSSATSLTRRTSTAPTSPTRRTSTTPTKKNPTSPTSKDKPQSPTRKSAPPTQNDRKLRHRKRAGGKTTGVKVDLTRPLEFPATPETIYEYHLQKPFLDRNEEWLIVELNEYECLVDSIDIIKIIAKHSKFFEVEPDELWEEFFEFVEEVPSYDEIINYDVWQEFRDNKYPC